MILTSLLGVHLGLAWHGVDRAAAQAAGWLIDPLPTGALLQAPAFGSLAAFDCALLVPILPKVLTCVAVAVVIQILYVVTIELDLRREFDVDRVFAASGLANLRLRTTTAGTVIGEIALVQGGRRTATALAETPCRVIGIDRAALARMERERPDLALTFQRFLILELAGKVVDTNRLLEVELQ